MEIKSVRTNHNLIFDYFSSEQKTNTQKVIYKQAASFVRWAES